MTWALKRQIFYLSIVLIFVGILAFLVIYPRINVAPTCSDGKQNGTETGIDCGGSCQLACIYQVDQVSILWSRAFQVVPGRYNAVAYIENHNKSTAIYKIGYRFRFADKDNIYIGKREGTTYVPPAGKFAVFEPAVDLGNSIPVYTTFEFTELPTWVQVSQDKIDQLKIDISQISLTDETTSPKLSAVIKNNSLFQIPEVNVVTILYDVAGNVVSASRTYLDLLNAEETANLNFTWPQAFPKKVISEEIIPMYNIFSVKLK